MDTAAYRQQASTAVSDRPDGLTFCLERLINLTGELAVNNDRLRTIADGIGGSEPEKLSGAGQPEPPMPNIPLFMARKLESILQYQLENQRGSMARIERAIA